MGRLVAQSKDIAFPQFKLRQLSDATGRIARPRGAIDRPKRIARGPINSVVWIMLSGDQPNTNSCVCASLRSGWAKRLGDSADSAFRLRFRFDPIARRLAMTLGWPGSDAIRSIFVLRIQASSGRNPAVVPVRQTQVSRHLAGRSSRVPASHPMQ